MGTMRFLKQQVVKEETNTESPARKIKLYLKNCSVYTFEFNQVEYKYFYTLNNNLCISDQSRLHPSVYQKIPLKYFLFLEY